MGVARTPPKYYKCNIQQTDVVLSDKNMKSFQLWTVTRQGCSLSPQLYKISFKVLAIAIKQGRKIKGIQIGKAEFILFTNDMMSY